MLLTDASSTLMSVAPTAGGLTTRPCNIPGTRTVWTNSAWAVTSPGMSRRGTGLPSTVHSLEGFRFAFGVAADPDGLLLGAADGFGGDALAVGHPHGECRGGHGHRHEDVDEITGYR